MSWLAVPVATLAFVVILVLPGFGLLRAGRLGGHGTSSDLLRAVAFSIILLSAISSITLWTATFSPIIVTIPLIALGSIGLPGFFRLIVRRDIWPLLSACSLLSLPWAITAMRDGFPPANRLQWYYWELGKKLTESGGIPDSVAEWGVQVRWLPDYLYFNVLSEVYRFLVFTTGDLQALAAWRYPMAILGYLLVFLVLRLWVDKSTAYFGVILLSITNFFTVRIFDAYKPEAAGIVVGLLAAWLVITGIRRSQSHYLILAGALVGINLGIHAIAATSLGIMAIAAGTVEWLDLKRGRRRAALLLSASAVLALLIAASSGLLLQGRALVATDALRPEQMEGSDPTWTFLETSSGRFDEGQPPELWDQLISGWETRLSGVAIIDYPWLIVLLVPGVVVAISRSPRKFRSGLLTVGLSLLLLSVLICFFLLAFDTYVPRHTGAARLMGYLAVFLSFLTAISLGALWHSLSKSPQWPPVTQRFTALLFVAVLIVGFQSVDKQFRSQQAMDHSLAEALEALSLRADHGDVVLSNVVTYGLIETFTDTEAPLEARQPLIEEPGLLAHANDLLVSTHTFLQSGDTNPTVDELAPDWVLIVDRPSIFGLGASYGGAVSSLGMSPRLDMAWSRPGVALFEYRSEKDVVGTRLELFESMSETHETYAAGLWDLDEGRGTRAWDTSGHGNHGTIQGARHRCDDTPYHLVDDAEGRCALQFDTNDDRVTIPGSSSLHTGDAFTVSAWIKQTGSTDLPFQRIVDKDGSFSLWVDSQQKSICIRLMGTTKDTPGDQVCFPVAFNQYMWHHVLFTYDPRADERLRLYLDSELVGESNEYRGNYGDTGSELIIGNWESGTRPFRGLISDVRIYSTAVHLESSPYEPNE